MEIQRLPGINWTTVVVQAVVQVLMVGSLLVGYIITNEHWKGAIDANITNLAEANKAQAITNERLRIATEQLTISVRLISENQQRVIALLEYHMGIKVTNESRR